MTADNITIIWDYRREGREAFDVSYQGGRYADHRATAEGSRFAHSVRVTAERQGFRYVENRGAFVQAFEPDGTEPRRLVEAFKRQGFDVRNVGAVPDAIQPTAARPTSRPTGRPPEARGRPVRQQPARTLEALSL